MLSARPARARHVRALSVFPDCSPLSIRLSYSSLPPSLSLSLAEESVGRQRTSGWGRGVLPDGYAVSSAVRGAARRLEVLRCFVWDGEELPPYDDMWFALRVSCVHLFSRCLSVFFVGFKAAFTVCFFSCPHLKFISTTLGSILPSPNSHVRVPISLNPTTGKRRTPFSSCLISPTSTDSR